MIANLSAPGFNPTMRRTLRGLGDELVVSYSNPPQTDPIVAQYAQQYDPGDADNCAAWISQNRLWTDYCNGIQSDIAGLTTTAQAVGSAATITNDVIPGLGSLVSAIGNLFSAHAHAVVQENQTLCDVVTAWNTFQSQAEFGLSTGAETVNTATQAQNQLKTVLFGAMSQIYKSCNSACGVEKYIEAIIAYNDDVRYPAIAASFAQYQAANAPAPAAVQSSVAATSAPQSAQAPAATPGGVAASNVIPSGVSSAGVHGFSWGEIAAVGIGLFLLVKIL